MTVLKLTQQGKVVLSSYWQVHISIDPTSSSETDWISLSSSVRSSGMFKLPTRFQSTQLGAVIHSNHWPAHTLTGFQLIQQSQLISSKQLPIQGPVNLLTKFQLTWTWSKGNFEPLTSPVFNHLNKFQWYHQTTDQLILRLDLYWLTRSSGIFKSLTSSPDDWCLNHLLSIIWIHR